jgi:hypothetical protein
MQTIRPLSWSEHAAASHLARAAYARGDWRGYYIAARAMGRMCRIVGPRLSQGQARRMVRRSLVPMATLRLVSAFVTPNFSA